MAYRKNKKKSIGIKIGIIVILILFASILGMGAYYIYGEMLKPVSKDTTQIEVVIPMGSTAENVGDILDEQGLIKNKMVFVSYIGRHSRGGKEILAGTYLVSKSQSVDEIFDILTSGDDVAGVVSVLLPESRNIKEMGNILEENGICTAEEFINETKQVDKYKALYPILGNIPVGKDRALEGYLFADTYNFTKGMDAEKVVKMMLNRYDEIYKTNIGSAMQETDKSLDEIMIMASLVELEAKFVEDKANVASVFYNRLDEDMLLQSCITADYAGGTKTDILTYEQTQIDSPYNTYMYTGLPPGPICAPSLTSIEAAIKPATTNYYYFVADLDIGKLHFNETLDAHNADVQKYLGN